MPANLLRKICYVSLLLLLYNIRADAQNTPETVLITLDQEQAPLQKIMKDIAKQSGINFFYSVRQVNTGQKISVHYDHIPMSRVLQDIFPPRSLSWKYVPQQNAILLKPVESPAPRRPIQERAARDTATIQISGVVRDGLNSLMSGVTVTDINNLHSVMTDTAGAYHLRVSVGDSIRFTYIGYTPFTVKVKDRFVIDAVLDAIPGSLNDIVIVGYGQQKKITSVGAVSTLNAEELKQPVANISDLIAGRVAGVIGVQRSGQPGYDGADIYIRGISTFTNSSPLVLVDGVERDFSAVDPEDIANFSILKDASATAVYGVRGANGVILIQTKKGKAGKPLLNFQYDEGLTQFTRIPQLADGVTYMEMANEAYHNSHPEDPLPKYSEDRIEKTKDHSDPDLYPDVNWFKELFNKFGDNRRARVNASGGSENAKYYLSVGYYDETGLDKTDELAKYNSSLRYKRYNFTSNLNLQVTKTTKVDFGASGWISNGNYPGTAVQDIWSSAYVSTPISIPLKYSDGHLSQIASADVYNPYNLLTQTGYISEFRSQLWSNLRVTQDLGFWLKGLSITGMFSFDNYNAHTINMTKTPDAYLATGRDTAGNLTFQQTEVGSGYLNYSHSNGGTRQYYTEAAINYANHFGDHNVTGMILYNQSDKTDAFAGDFISAIPYRYRSLVGRLTYDYKEKYMAEANFGYNGSETFAPDHRYGFFPSFGVGYVVSKENFFENIRKAIQFLKFRFTYGITGNGDIGGRRFAYLPIVATTNGYSYGNNVNNNIGGLAVGDFAVDVSWEKAKKTDLGIDLKALDNALTLNADLFQEIRTNIFLQRGDVPQYVGVANLPYANLGEIHNRGLDATLDYSKQIHHDFNLEFRGNITYTHSIVINDANAPWPYPWQQHIGRKYGQRFGYTALGLFKSDDEVANSPVQTGTTEAGDIRYKDLNGDGIINSYDEGPIGHGAIPQIVYGFGPTITWKNWSVSGWFKGISSVDIMLNGDGLQPFSQGGERGNLLAQITDRWTPDNPNPRPMYPRLTYGNDNMNYQTSTWWLKNGAFLRLQTAELSYDFRGKKWLDKVGMSNLDLYFIGENLLTISGFKLWDPELGDGRGAQYPLIKAFNIGVKCTFR